MTQRCSTYYQLILNVWTISEIFAKCQGASGQITAATMVLKIPTPGVSISRKQKLGLQKSQILGRAWVGLGPWAE